MGSGRSQAVLAFGKSAGEPCNLVQGLVDCDLKGALFVFQQGKFLARGGELAFKLYDALLGRIELILQRPARLRDRSALRRLMCQLTVELGNLGALSFDFIRQFQAIAFQSAIGFTRKLQFFAQPFDLCFCCGGLSFDLIKFGAKCLV